MVLFKNIRFGISLLDPVVDAAVLHCAADHLYFIEHLVEAVDKLPVRSAADRQTYQLSGNVLLFACSDVLNDHAVICDLNEAV